MSKKNLESAIRALTEGKESGKPTPKVATPGNAVQPDEGTDPGKGGNDPKTKSGVEEPMKDPLLTDPESKHALIAKVANATSKTKGRKADKAGMKEEEEIDNDFADILDEAEESDTEVVEVDEDIYDLVVGLDEDELRVRYAELLAANLAEDIDEDDDSEHIEETVSEVRRRITADDLDLSEDVDAMFGGEDLSEDFQNKAKTIFEAAVLLQVNTKLDELEESFKHELTEETARFETGLTDKIDEYLNYVVEEWMTKNELAVERGLRAEISEEFIGGLQNLFLENYIDVPTEKIDVVEQLAGEVDDLKIALNEQIENNIDLMSQRDEMSRRDIIVDELSELADSQIEKVVALAENVKFEDADQFRAAVGILKEGYLPTASATTKDDFDVDEDLSETLDESAEVSQLDPAMSEYVRTLGSQVK